MKSWLANPLLSIEAEKTLGQLQICLHGVIENSSAGGLLLGLSGGIDSTVLAAIAVEALGRQSVHLSYLYDQHSSKEQYQNVLTVSDWLGVEIEMRSIEAAMREKGVYSPLGMRITSFSGRFNRLLHHAYRKIFNESPFISSLKIGHDHSLERMSGVIGFRGIIRQPEAGMNMRHIYRRKVLEAEARKDGWLLIGAANRTEWQIGWFVKGGIDDLPIQPLKGLYKTQVRQLASSLQLPTKVISQLPSPDMIKGITDELALEMSYAKIDLVLDYLEGGLTIEEIGEAGCNEKEIHLVCEMNRLSDWKRGERRAPAPVDGGPKGGLRCR